MFGTLLNPSGIRCYKRLSEEQAQSNTNRIVWCEEDVVREVDGKKTKLTIDVAYAALPPIVFGTDKTLEACIAQIIESEAFPNSRCLTKNERGQWALIEVGEKRLFISNSIISD